MIARTNELAENVSAKVRQLDLARVSYYSENIIDMSLYNFL